MNTDEMQFLGAKACGDIFRARAQALLDRTAPGMPILPKAPDRVSVADAQQRLFDAGYTMVGNVDGLIGLRSRAAIRTMQEVNGLPVTGNLDAETMKTLRGPMLMPMPVSPERQAATARTLRATSPIVRDAEDGETVGKVAAGGTAVLGFGGFLTQVSDQASTVKTMLGDAIPSWAWFLIVLAIAGGTAGFIWWNSHRIKERRVAMHQAGETA